MRLVSLRDNRSLLTPCVDMMADYLIEMNNTNGPQNPDAAKKQAARLLQERLVDSNREIFLFENNRKFVGFSEVQVDEECFPDEDLPEKRVRLISFYVAPDSRRQGLGSSFFKLIRTWGRDQEASLIEMEVPTYPISSNEFLQHQGLELVGSGTDNCYRAFI